MQWLVKQFRLDVKPGAGDAVDVFIHLPELFVAHTVICKRPCDV